MYTDITLKYAAIAQLKLSKTFRDVAQENSSFIVLPSGIVYCVTDVTLNTLKYPLCAIEQASLTAINLIGLLFAEGCNLEDARRSFTKMVAATFLATPVMLVLSPVSLVSRLCVVLPNPTEARSANKEAEMEAKLESIVYPSMREESLAI